MTIDILYYDEDVVCEIVLTLFCATRVDPSQEQATVVFYRKHGVVNIDNIWNICSF